MASRRMRLRLRSDSNEFMANPAGAARPWSSTRLDYSSFLAEFDRQEAPRHRDLGTRIGRAFEPDARPDQIRLLAQTHHPVVPGTWRERIEAYAVVLDPQLEFTAADGLQGHDQPGGLGMPLDIAQHLLPHAQDGLGAFVAEAG